MTTQESDRQAESRDALRDRRVRPRGVLPRHLQTWLMAGLAAAILLVILVTGKPKLPPRSPGVTGGAGGAALPPDRLRQYQEQLADQERKLGQELAEAQASAAATAPPQSPSEARDTARVADPLAEERRRREYASLFSETVAFTRRAAGTAPSTAGAGTAGRTEPAPPDSALRLPVPAPPNESSVIGADARGTRRERSEAVRPRLDSGAPADAGKGIPAIEEHPLAGNNRRLLEGTVIEAVLANRLAGTFTSPVNALVTSPVYSQNRQTVLIPAGARVLGTASAVQAYGETRLAVRFRRLIMPDGTSYSLDQFIGLNERGDAGLKDRIDRHYLQIFGASIAIGALSGLAQYSTRSATSAGYSFSDAYGQGVGGSLAASGGRILDRFLNVLPDVTIREGHRLKIYLTRDLDLPPYPNQIAR